MLTVERGVPDRARQPSLESCQMRTDLQLPRVLRGPGSLVLDTRARTVEVDGSPIVLTRLGFDILAILLQRRGEVVSHDELALLAWGQRPTENHGSIQTGIYRVRLALEETRAQDLIRSIRGVGYTIDPVIEESVSLLDRSPLEATLRACPVPLLLTHLNGAVALANRAAADLMRTDEAEVERITSWLALLAEGSQPSAEAAFDAAAGGTPRPAVRATLASATDVSSHVHLTLTPVANEGDTVLGVLVTLQPA